MSNYMCKAPGCCERAATRYGVYCNAHRSRQRRHGEANQDAISKADLKIYEQLVHDRIGKNKNKAIWQQLKARWGVIVQEAQEALEQSRKGTPMPSWKRTVAVELVKLSNTVEAEAVINTVLAIYLLQDHEPRKIKSDRAFRTQMVRRVRGLTKQNAGTWRDSSSGKTKIAYRELNAKAVDALSHKLVMAFGPTGVTIADLEKRDHERKQMELIEHNQALGDLQ
ncbi:hypothetical protein BB934_12360 [Microvirga ossetica]|uniref:Uncharacterized protein n=1 Tax=Microvirga ossetica TaxID=1882682 RepID=A0A1B2EG03_9HYPH|nr:hypothetical protein [Microvirga ossetica]ANY78906.1 hypothetical protein BB934_12360 [Microvirga ossetica]